MRRLMIASIFVAVSFKVSVSSVVMSDSVILLVSYWCKVWPQARHFVSVLYLFL